MSISPSSNDPSKISATPSEIQSNVINKSGLTFAPINVNQNEALSQSTTLPGLSYQETLQRVVHAVDKTNQSLPVLEQGGTIPKAAIIKSTDPNTIASNYRGPIAVLIPEAHIENKPLRKLDELDGITAHALKALNIRLLENLFSDPNLSIKAALNEGSMDRSSSGVTANKAYNSLDHEAVNVLELLVRFNDGSLKPAETIGNELKQSLVLKIFSLIKTILDVRTVTFKIDIADIFSLVSKIPDDSRKSSDLIKEVSDQLMQETNTQGMFSVTNNGYMTIDRNFLTTNDLYKLEHTFYNLFHTLKKRREDEIATSFSKAQGLTPMIIGSDHIQEYLLNKLQELNIPVIVIGAEAYLAN